MINFTQIKQSVTTRQAAEAYGLSVNAQGMTCCPFHNDRKPSMKVDETFYCFGCGAVGDVITFTSRYFGISPGSAARKLAADFGIPLDAPAADLVIPASPAQSEFHAWVHHALEVLRAYNQLLFEWKSLRPTAPGEDFHFLFVEALQNSATIQHLLWSLSFGSEEEKQEIYLHYREKVSEIEQRVRAYGTSRDPEEAANQQQGCGNADYCQLHDCFTA